MAKRATKKRAAPILVAESFTPEWYEARYTGFGASEMAAVAGVSLYTQPLVIYRRKVDRIEDVEETEQIEAGNFMEPAIRKWYCHRTGQKLQVEKPGMYRHPEIDYLFATPDSIISEKKLLECKNTNERMSVMWGAVETEQVPDDYFIQCQAQLEVMDAEVVDLAVCIGGCRLKIYPIQRDRELFAMVKSAAEELWQRIINRDPPPPDWTHPRTAELMRRIHSSFRDVRFDLSAEANEAWLKMEKINDKRRQLKQEADVLKAKVIAELADCYGGLLQDGRMVRQSMIEKAPYVCEPESYLDVRAVKYDRGHTVDREDEMAYRQQQQRHAQAEARLSMIGYSLTNVIGSARIFTRKNSPDIRVSDLDLPKISGKSEKNPRRLEIRIDSDAFVSQLGKLEKKLAIKE